MKNLKKLAALVLSLMLVLSLGVSTANETQTGSITITGIGTETTYEIYKVLDLESYNTTSGAYSYKVNADWTGFFATEDALKYIIIDDAGYVT